MDNSTIADHAQACAERFNVLASSSSSPGSLSPPAFEDQLARFRIWAANVGAFAEAHGSLDYRLRESPKIKKMMQQLLIGLERKLQRAMESTEEPKTRGLHSKLDSTSEDADSESDENATESEESISSQSSNSPPVSEPIAHFAPLMKHLKGIEAAIDRLHRLAMTIRGSSIHHRKSNTPDFVLRDENGNDISSQFEHFAIRMVQTRYPKANPLLHLRLGQAILQRRKRFAYQQRHQQKLALPARATHILPSARQLQHTGSVRDANVPRPDRAASPNVQRTFPYGHARTVLPTPTASALTLRTVRSRPPSSTLSSSTVTTNNDAENLYYPPRPIVTPGSKEFQCPYCGLVLGLEAEKGTRWKKHIINDLEPYICLFEHCTKVHEAFRTVGDWLQHMQGEHNIGWYCNCTECHDLMFDRQVDFEQHMKSLHAETFNPSQLPILSESSRRPATELFEQCPLCDNVSTIQELNVGKREGTRHDTGENLKTLPKHIAVHLEELALLSLPWQDDLNTAVSSMKTRSWGSKNSDREFILDDISLTFEDPFDDNVTSGHEGKTDIPIAEPFSISRESEWGFWPLPDYEGHMRDPLLRLLVERFLRQQIDVSAIGLAASAGLKAIVEAILYKEGSSISDSDKVQALLWAATEGFDGVVELMLANGVNVSAPGILAAAAQNNRLSVIQILLHRGTDVNSRSKERASALQAAALRGNESIIKTLLDHGADPNIDEGELGSVLHIAAINGDESIMRLLLDHGADINAKGGMYGYALQAAALRGNESIIRLLLDHDADINAKGEMYGYALQAAAEEGHENILRLPLEQEADVNLKGDRYGNALQAAVKKGHDNIMRLSLEQGADVNLKGDRYGNALQAAVKEEHDNIVRLSLEQGADVNLKGDRYGNALQAAAKEGHENIVRLLLEQGADVDLKGGCYGNALQAAAIEGHENIVRLLLEQGADVNLKGGPSGNALLAAAEHGNETIVELLLAAGADINMEIGGERYTALQEVARGGLVEMVALLLGHGANLAAQQRNGQTALFMAAKGGHAEVVALLLSKGANQNTRDERNLTPLDWAIKGNHTKVIAVLNMQGDRKF